MLPRISVFAMGVIFFNAMDGSNHANYKWERNFSMLKKLIKIDCSNHFWFEGQHQSSISQKQIGPIKECDVEGQIIVSISKSSLKFHL